MILGKLYTKAPPPTLIRIPHYTYMYMYISFRTCPDSATLCNPIWPVWHLRLQHLELCGTHQGPVSVQRCLWGQLCWGLVCYLSLLGCFENNEMTAELNHIKNAQIMSRWYDLFGTEIYEISTVHPCTRMHHPRGNLACWCCSFQTTVQTIG